MDDNALPSHFLVDVFIILIISSLSVFVLYKVFQFLEMAFVEYVNKKLFYNHFYLFRKKLTSQQLEILRNEFSFYRKLDQIHKSNFEHRMARVINRLEFIGKDIAISDEMKIVIAATQVKLTFGLRDFLIKSVDRIIIYPEEFYSQTNKTYHKGEFNLGYKALVFSWNDVVHGYHIEDDNLNLAVHEFTHAIHFYYMRVRRYSTSAAIFLDVYVELTNMLDRNAKLKSELVRSKFLRDYAYTNQFEFLSVILETFIESPEQFKLQFPEIYEKVKTMLNFNFAGY
ncbi:zinc-dependent peptidase [Psychroserpens sp.]|uniref:zinc-dependent peptidase n=1 Tax=Psychroserpens sp. TaxID=2020870 RepID=UPI001B1C98E6|nr:zinc-dependent peptidase [Psychroserpens sp.]MBO6681469.1 zinc-dependent peptidase [Psychroserpens sp.]MBO6749244.1 zinc-dependent peptidase [Psychroserpens sp.]MBO6914310.1 zinc-dependent peptidase [Psychroserpens sp.]MBO6941471.1 zinc-dependent peptidase [Psychroserpens sp.]